MTNETLHAISKALEREKKQCPNFPIHKGGQLIKLLIPIGRLSKYLNAEKYQGKDLKKGIDNILINVIAVSLRMLENNK